MKKNRGKNIDRGTIEHYRRIFNLAIHAVMESLLNGDKQFSNKAKAVWLQSATEARDKGIDLAIQGMPDFTGCETAIQLMEWKLNNNVTASHYADRIYRAEHDRMEEQEGESLIEGKNSLEAITEGEKEDGTIPLPNKRSSLRTKVMRSKKKKGKEATKK